MRFLDVRIPLCVSLKQPKEYYIGCKNLLLRLSPENRSEVVATTLLTPLVFYFILENRENFPETN
jgi:hypothetical protein